MGTLVRGGQPEVGVGGEEGGTWSTIYRKRCNELRITVEDVRAGIFLENKFKYQSAHNNV